jgi:hypothetical protein
VVRIPKGALHKVENASVDEPVTFISVYSPAGMDQYFLKLAEKLETGQLAHGGREGCKRNMGLYLKAPFSHNGNERSKARVLPTAGDRRAAITLILLMVDRRRTR